MVACPAALIMPGLPGYIGVRGAPAFSPISIPNLDLWLDANSITGLNDGDGVATFPDISGNSRSATQGTTANQPTYKTNIANGRPALLFGTGKRMLTPSFLTSAYNTIITVASVVVSAGGSLGVHLGNNASGTYIGESSSKPIFNGGSLSTGTSNTQVNTSTGLYLVLTTYNGSQIASRVYNVSQSSLKSTSTTGNLALTGAAEIGALNGSFNWTGHVVEELIYNKVLTSAEIINLATYINQRYGLVNPSKASIYCDGNSLTFGTKASSAAFSYPSQLQALLPNTIVTNIGVPGDATLDLKTLDSTKLYPYYDGIRARNIAIMWEITNDLVVNQSATGAYNNVVSWCQAAQAIGFKVIVMTCLPRTQAGLYANFETDRQTVNTNVKNNWATFADAIYDVGNDPQIGYDGAQLTALYDTDHVHLVDAGYAIVANGLAPIVTSLM